MSTSDIMKTANELSKKHEIMSNVYRTLILIYLYQKGSSSWTDIRKFIESKSGSLNPNTLHFHLKYLMERGYVTRSGSQENSLYKLDKLDKFLQEELAEVIQKEV